jgi:aerobic carbon-monoxide dehydrogenase large subunit
VSEGEARLPLVGAEVLRREDLPLLTGAARFVADIDRQGQVWARVVRSPVAHGRLRGVDAGAALEMAGVVAVLTAADVPEVRIPIRLPFAETPDANLALQPPLARDRVRYVGEPVALVLAESQHEAEDAAELVLPDIEELAPELDVVAAAERPKEVLHAELGRNAVVRVPSVYGDVEAAFARADVVVRERLEVHRHTAAPMETRGLVAEVDEATGRLTMWGATKVKHFNRAALARMLGLEPDRIRLLEVDVGGGFGVRGELYPEDVLVAFAARSFGRPVKWVEDRYEHFLATNHARHQVHEIEVAALADGTLLAFRDRAWADQGAYVRTQGILPPLLPVAHLPGPYAWEAFAIESAGVLTNRTPTGTYRAPGVTEACFVRERMVDLVAARLGLDPVEVRRRNLLRETPFRYDLGEDSPPIVYDSGRPQQFFEQLLERAGWEALRAEREERRAAGELVGIGVAAFMEAGGVGPFERAAIVPQPDGAFAVLVGVASLGQGIGTALAQIAADELAVPLDEVDVRYRDTDEGPEGFGSFASRSVVLAGNAIALAARDLRGKAGEGPLDAAALAREGVVGEGTFEKQGLSYSFGANLALVSVDAETGQVRVERYVVAYDVGRAVNPAALRGQLAGAAAQGIAAALFEELHFDEWGQPLSPSFVDYLMPTAAELPPVDVLVIEHPTPANPLGVKGGGEGGMAGTLGTVANAVADALGEPGAVTTLPLTPARVASLLR